MCNFDELLRHQSTISNCMLGGGISDIQQDTRVDTVRARPTLAFGSGWFLLHSSLRDLICIIQIFFFKLAGFLWH